MCVCHFFGTVSKRCKPRLQNLHCGLPQRLQFGVTKFRATLIKEFYRTKASNRVPLKVAFLFDSSSVKRLHVGIIQGGPKKLHKVNDTIILQPYVIESVQFFWTTLYIISSTSDKLFGVLTPMNLNDLRPPNYGILVIFCDSRLRRTFDSKLQRNGWR